MTMVLRAIQVNYDKGSDQTTAALTNAYKMADVVLIQEPWVRWSQEVQWYTIQDRNFKFIWGESTKEEEPPRVLTVIRNHIQSEWMQVRDRDVVAVVIERLLVVNVYNQKPPTKTKKKRGREDRSEEKREEEGRKMGGRKWMVERVNIVSIV